MGTIRGYCHKLAAFCLHFQKLPESLSEDDCRDYFSLLLSRDPSPGISYFKHTVYGLRCYRKMMHLSDLDFPLPRIRTEKKLPVVLSVEEIRRFLSCCEGIRTRAMFSLVYSCGLRIGELINMRISHVDSDRMQVLIYQGKGRKDRYVPLSAKALSDLRAYFLAYKPSVYLFNDSPGKRISEREVRYLFRDVVRLARISKPCTPHTLRYPNFYKIQTFLDYMLYIRCLSREKFGFHYTTPQLSKAA